MYRPVSGSFSEYAREFMGPFAGFVTGWTYWLFWVVTGITEVTAAATYMTYWWDIPQWLSALVFTVILYGANLISVKLFGELEFWFSMVKVTAIVGMILICAGILTIGFSDAGDTASVTHLWDLGGFFAGKDGIYSTLMTLQMVMFAFLAVELVGVTAGESKDPKTVLPKAINTVPWRIAVFYVGALIMILSVVPWTEFKPGVSPFVAAFEKMGLGVGAAIVNFVRPDGRALLLQLGHVLHRPHAARPRAQRPGPEGLHEADPLRHPADRHHVPAALMMVGVWINYQWPGEAFNYVVSFATISGMWAWIAILICQHPLPRQGRPRRAARVLLQGARRRLAQRLRPGLPRAGHRDHGHGRGQPGRAVRRAGLGPGPGRLLPGPQGPQPPGRAFVKRS
ncbi:Phenylalanine-specific permease [Streptomyces narbonensis]